MPADPEPGPPTELTPDKPDRLKRTEAPPLDQTYVRADDQKSDGGKYHLRGRVVLSQIDATLRADEIDYDEDTGDAEARGHVFYENFNQNEKITCDRVEYNFETRRGKFYNVHGYVKTHIDARPGLLTSNNPFYFQGDWAERIDDKYIVHQGLITGCKLPHPWWTLTGPKFDVVPGERAIAYNSWFHLRHFPLFYTPFFYKSLEREPRKSGFLTPNLGHSSIRGYMLGAGYFWAINRSYDATYFFQDWTARGYAHRLDVRGKPNERTDFNVIAFGVQDRGLKTKSDPAGTSYSGADVTGTIRSDLGGGWFARGNVDYLSSLAFRERFTDSFNEAIFSASTSTGWVGKNAGATNLDIIAQRVQLFQDTTKDNFVILRKLPEVDYSSRDQQIAGELPLWLSWDAGAGLLHRSNPLEYVPGTATVQESAYSTADFLPRIDFAPRLMTAFRVAGFTATPSVTLHETFFGQGFAPGTQVGPVLPSNVIRSEGINRVAAEFGFDLTFPAIERVYHRKTFLGEKIKHVIEPRATYKYVTGVNEFNRLIRFDQTELLTDTNQVELSVTNRLYVKRGDTVRELLTWELAQQRYFDPSFGGALISGQRNVTLDSLDFTAYAFLDQPRRYSPVASRLRLNTSNGFSVVWQADYDPLRGGVLDSGFTADFRWKKYFASAGNNEVRGVNVFAPPGQTQTQNQNFLSPPANQFRGVGGWGDTNRRGWNGAVSAVYDYRTSVLQYVIAQATYNTDCCGISGQYRLLDFGSGITARHENQYRVAFTIANVGSFGNMRKQERIF